MTELQDLARKCMANEMRRLKAAHGVVELTEEQKCERYKKRLALARERGRKRLRLERERKEESNGKSSTGIVTARPSEVRHV